jgi:DNA-binding cell septation regulator SpoVG
MDLTYEVKYIRPVNKGKLLAFADICIGGMWVVKGFKIVETDGELWVGKPRTNRGTKWFDIVYPLEDTELKKVEAIILEEYNRTIGERDG